ncbi:MAG: hypothetical protein H6741_18045 [Alphaproteobacteria bacterium]|nr:hypothetical protein [Alphaproteobacteria bacterium]
MSLALLALLTGCVKPLPDPLAAQRGALSDLRESPPPGWAPHASLVLGRAILDAAMLDAVTLALPWTQETMSTTAFGVTLSATPQLEVRDARMRGSALCESCLELEIDLEGSSLLALENRTGRREGAWPFTGTLRGVMEVALDADGETIVGRIAAPDSWKADVQLEDLPLGFNAMFSQALSELARPVLERPDLPALPLIVLPDLGEARLNAVRVRPAGEHLVVDFHLPIPTAGEVRELPDPGEGWVAVLPAESALGLMQAAALAVPYDPEDGVLPEYTGLRFEDQGFVLDALAWPTRAPTLAGRPLGKKEPRPVRVRGRVGLTEAGELEVVTETAEWGTPGGAPPDLAALLMGQRPMKRLVETARATTPAKGEQELAGVAVVAWAERAVTVDNQLRVEGSMRAASAGSP